MKKANNFEEGKFSLALAFAWFFANLSLALLIKVLLIKKACSIKKPTYCQLLTSFRISNQIFVDLILFIEPDVFCWSFEFFIVDFLFL